MKKMILIIFAICTCLIFFYAFSASYNSNNIDHLDYVIAIGVDTSDDEKNLQVSFEFTDLGAFSESNSSDSSEPIINTVTAASIPDAINLMNAYAGKQINLSHCRVIAFSEDIAKIGILEEVTYFMNNTQIRPTANVIIASKTAKDYIESSTSSLEDVLTKYYEVFPTSAEYTGYTSNIMLNKFYHSLTNDACGAVAILGVKSESNEENSSDSGNSSSSSNSNTNSSSTNSSSSSNTQNPTKDILENITNSISSLEQESSDNSSTSSLTDNALDSISQGESIVDGDRGTENIGLAVFNQDKYIGTLSAIDTLCYTLIEEEVGNFSVLIPNPFDETKKIDVSVSSLEPAYTKIDISNDTPIITVNLNLTAKALTGHTNLNYSDKNTLNAVNESLKTYFTAKLKDYLYKTSREYKCDLNGFFRVIKHKFLTVPDYENYNWKEKYQNAEFNIEIDSNVISSFLVQDA